MEFLDMNSPIGPLRLKAERGALTELDFIAAPEKTEAENTEDGLLLLRAREELREYFLGERRQFDIPLRPEGSAFSIAVWREMEKIQYGETKTYGEIAAALGKTKAAQAVGNACGKNPIPVLLPCHRVVRAHGLLGGYTGGTEKKEILLQVERKGNALGV